MSEGLAGLLGPGAIYRGDLVFEGRVRVEGTFEGSIRSDDLLEVAPTGRVVGQVDVAQALIAGTVEGRLRARERCTLLESSRVAGRLETPWLDARLGCVIEAELLVRRDLPEEPAPANDEDEEAS